MINSIKWTTSRARNIGVTWWGWRSWLFGSDWLYGERWIDIGPLEIWWRVKEGGDD